MAIAGGSTWEQVGQRVNLADQPFQPGAVPVELEDVTLVEGAVEIRLVTAAGLVVPELELPTPGILRCAVWEWPVIDSTTQSETHARLAELRISSYTGRARFGFPLMSVFDGHPRQFEMLRAVGIPCEAGNIHLSTHNDAARALITTPSHGTVDLRVLLRDEIETTGLQFRLAPLVNLFPAGDSPVLAVTELAHAFDKLKRGTVELEFTGPISECIGRHDITQVVMGMVAHGDVQLAEPWQVSTSVAVG